MTTETPFNIVIALYPGVTQLDFTGPHQVLTRLPGAKVIPASLDGADIEAEGLVFSRLQPFTDIAAEDVSLLLIPGGFGTAAQIGNPEFLSHIVRLASKAKYLTSVCTGSLLLGAAGLLKGKRAATHWAWMDELASFGAIPTRARVVRDGNIFTGGGVTAGIDFALTLLAEIAGAEFAQASQLGLEYAPAPPFNSGSPDTAPPEILATVRERYSRRVEETREIIRQFNAQT